MYIHTKLHRQIHVVHAYICSPENPLKVWGYDSIQHLQALLIFGPPAVGKSTISMEAGCVFMVWQASCIVVFG